MKKLKIIFIVLLFSGLHSAAQYKLTLPQAIEIAIQNNYSIGIIKADADISRISNSYGNAGFLPSVTFLASTNKSSYNTKQEFNTGASVNRKNAISSNFASSIVMNWTLFDGMKMFATKDKLEALQARGTVNLKIEIENTVAQIIRLYFDVVHSQQLIKATNDALGIYIEREKIAQKKLDIGSGSKLDLLQAKVDLNAQRSTLLKLNIAMESAMVAMNQLLSKNSTDMYTVEDSITVNDSLVLTGMQQNASANNNQILFAQHNIAIANYSLREVKSTTLPQFGVTVNYNLTQTQNQVGLILLNQNRGFNGGLYASWNLFNGYKSQTQIKIAKYSIKQSVLALKQTSSIVDASLLKAWKNYEGALTILKLEQENIGIAKENVSIALERFRLGTSNNIELMFAQQSYQDALSRLVSARYEAKLSETELLRLQGQLVR